jgi:Holliday junction resolvase
MTKKINSKQKGARFERAIAHILNDAGYTARRGQQFCGANGDADVIAPDFPFHLECKHVEKLNLYAAMTQAIGDAKKAGKPPCVIHKKNHSEELFTCRLDDLLKLLTSLQK